MVLYHWENGTYSIGGGAVSRINFLKYGILQKVVLFHNEHVLKYYSP